MTPCCEDLDGMSPRDRTLIYELKNILHLVYVVTQSPLQVLSFYRGYVPPAFFANCLPQVNLLLGERFILLLAWPCSFLSLGVLCLLPLCTVLSPHFRVEEAIDLLSQQIFIEYLLCQALG